MKNERLTKFEDFTNLYSLEKTLRFSLIPVEGTDTEHLQKIIREDERRAEYYKQVKKYIDEYHKWFINQSLSQFQFQYEDNKKQNSLSEYYQYKTNSKKRKKELNINKIQANLRKQVSNVRKLIKILTRNGLLQTLYLLLFKMNLIRRFFKNSISLPVIFPSFTKIGRISIRKKKNQRQLLSVSSTRIFPDLLTTCMFSILSVRFRSLKKVSVISAKVLPTS